MSAHFTEKQLNETKASLAVIDTALAALNDYWQSDAAAPSVVLLEMGLARKSLEQAKHYAGLVLENAGDEARPGDGATPKETTL